ncbi:hypothetical protein CAP48_11545 [Advenella sp. S44]|uniref:hypothetical protein n=1 Tax=Advenella sp. S44 TaxID=1982755 RepID=UPI000C2A1E75|nr:hypothetical protein [Advenella sp. S44]PJX24131.1 hypothetical protein CAP48_11545 [Advenella sp. S44]
MPSHCANAGKQTVVLDKSGLTKKVYIVKDADLPLSSGSYLETNPAQVGLTSVIHTSKYSDRKGIWNYEGYKWNYQASTKTAILVYRSGNELRRIDIGPKGVNGIPDLKAVFRAPLGDPENADWIAIIDASTGGDIATPPICNFALANENGSTALTYTGGNHADSGGAWGNPTARNISFSFLPDGKQVTSDGSGVATKVYFSFFNRVQAANTTTLNRETMEQRGLYQFESGVFLTHIIWIALELVRVVTDNGPQVITTGFRHGTFKYLGKKNTRSAFTSETNSGAKILFPDVWGMSFKDATNGELIVWMDRDYEAGDGRYVGTMRPMIKGGGAFNTKFYNAAVSIPDAELILHAGDSYEWRGGYIYRSEQQEVTGFDNVVPNSCLQSALRFLKFEGADNLLVRKKSLVSQIDDPPAPDLFQHISSIQFFKNISMKWTNLLHFIGFDPSVRKASNLKDAKLLEPTYLSGKEIVRECADPLLVSGWGSSSMWLARQKFADMFAEMIPGSIFFKGGSSGAFTDEIAGRLGSIPLLVKVERSKIVKSGATRIFVSNCQPRASFKPFTGTLNGIQGTISCTTSGFIFTRETSGNTVFSPDEYPFISELGNFFKNGIMLLWMGKNDITQGWPVEEIIARTDASFDFHNLRHARCLVMGHFIDSNTPDIDRRRDAIYQVNAAHESRYAQLFVDIQRFLTSPEWWAYTGLTPTQEDLELQARGNKPYSGSQDAGHLNDIGSAAVTSFLKDHIQSLGWFDDVQTRRKDH